MSVSNIITNENEKPLTEKCSINISNECTSNNIVTIEEEMSKNLKVEQKKSLPKNKKRKKKKKKNRHIRIICRSKKIQKSKSEIDRNTPKKEDTPKKNKLQDGRELRKMYLAQLIKKKKIYSEKVKLMKLIKRNTSAKLKENNSLELIKKYSQQVLNTNRAAINIQKKRDEGKEKEKEKEILELLGIKNDDFPKNINLSSIKLNTSINERPKLLPLLILNNSQNKINNLKNNPMINSNNRYLNSRKAELRKCQSLGISEFISKSSDRKSNNNSNNSNSIYNKNNLIKININNSSSRNYGLIKSRAKSPQDKSQLNCERIAKIRKEYQKQTVKESLKDFNRLYYSILPGNASYLVKNCMCHRTNWREAFTYATNLYNFRWQQLSSGIDYVGLGKYGAIKQVVNHYENHFSISNKANMFINLMYYCEQRKLSVFKYAPFTIILEFKSDYKLNDEENQKLYEEKLEKLKNFIEKTEKYVTNYNDIGKYYNDNKFIEEKKNRIEFFKEKKPKRRGIFSNNIISEDFEEDIKEFNGEYKMYRDCFKKIKLFDKITISNSSELYEKEKKRKKEFEKKIGTNTVIEIPDTHYNGKNMWVIKAINLNRGMCIQIVNNYKQMCTVLNKFKEGVDYHFTEKVIEEENIPAEENKKENEEEKSKETKDAKENQTNQKSEKEEENNKPPMYYCSRILIQKYIENPLLYKGRKCDMRVWVLLTHNMKVYFFKEGHLKTCSITYDVNSKDAFRHITNYSFQKYNDNFQKYEKGNEVPFYEFQKFIDENYADKNYKLNKDLSEQIKEIVSITTKSVKDQINKNERKYQFEIFGYDFMLDSNFNLFLIEINDNPGIEESSPWIKVIVPRMLDDALRLTLDQLFNPCYDFNKIYKDEESTNNMKMVLNNLKNKIDPNGIEEAKDSTNDDNKEKDENKKNENNNKKSEKKESCSCQTGQINSSKNNEVEKPKEEVIIDNNKSGKYVTPFPVPGYRDDENLWEFVCDLNSKDPLDDNLDKEEVSIKDFTGIKYLYNKRKNGIKNKAEDEHKVLTQNISNSTFDNKKN